MVPARADLVIPETQCWEWAISCLGSGFSVAMGSHRRHTLEQRMFFQVANHPLVQLKYIRDRVDDAALTTYHRNTVGDTLPISRQGGREYRREGESTGGKAYGREYGREYGSTGVREYGREYGSTGGREGGRDVLARLAGGGLRQGICIPTRLAAVGDNTVGAQLYGAFLPPPTGRFTRVQLNIAPHGCN